MVRTAVMRVCSGNYRAAPYLNFLGLYLFRWLAWCRFGSLNWDRLESAAIAVMLCRRCICRAQGCLGCLVTE